MVDDWNEIHTAIHRRYDVLAEPNRFLTFLVMMVLVLSLASWLLLPLLVTRWWFLYGKKE